MTFLARPSRLDGMIGAGDSCAKAKELALGEKLREKALAAYSDRPVDTPSNRGG